MTQTHLTILHSNDMHGDFLTEQLEDKLVGGVSMLSGYVKRVRAEEENVIYAIAGDMFKGSIIDSEYKGLSTIEIMNLIAPDVVTLGNHEIDYGVAHLLFIEKCARFPIINANLFITTNHVRLFTPYCVLERGGLKIMFIGVITDEVLASAKGEAVIGSFIDVREAANEVGVICDTYKTTEIDYTVVLSHIGFEADKQLAALLDENWGVDLIIGGHSHTLLQEPCRVNGVRIVQAGVGTDQIGRLDLTFDAQTRAVTDTQWTCVPVDSGHCPTDATLEELLHSYKRQTDEKYGRVLAYLPRELTHPSRYEETAVGNLFADVMQTDSSFDIMLLGSGSLRLKTFGPIITLQSLHEMFPYDDTLHLVEVTGAQLKRMIAFVCREEAFTEGAHTEFYQYSKGVRFVWSRSAQRFTEFSLNGKEIGDAQMIKLGIQKYHYENFADFFNVPLEEIVGNRRPRVVGTSCRAIYEELFASAEALDAQVEGRLVVTA